MNRLTLTPLPASVWMDSQMPDALRLSVISSNDFVFNLSFPLPPSSLS